MKAVKAITGNVTRVQGNAYWEDPSNPITNGMPYRWRVTASVSAKLHGDASTQTPNEFNGLDIHNGEWFADPSGRVYKIVEIISQTNASIVLIVEDPSFDVTFNSNSMAGAPSRGMVLFFTLTDTGQPIIDGIVDGTYAATSMVNIITYFSRKNPVNSHVVVNQSNHGFVVGDVIKIHDAVSGYYDLVNNSAADVSVGIVTGINSPSDSFFTYKPFGPILDNVNPPLVGEYGDIFYEDPANPGKLTTVRPKRNVRPIYVRLENENRAVFLNGVVDTVNVTVSFEYEGAILDQVEFTLPDEAEEVLEMSINGIENKNFTFDPVSKVLVFDPVATGYGVDETDEILFVFNKSE